MRWISNMNKIEIKHVFCTVYSPFSIAANSPLIGSCRTCICWNAIKSRNWFSILRPKFYGQLNVNIKWEITFDFAAFDRCECSVHRAICWIDAVMLYAHPNWGSNRITIRKNPAKSRNSFMGVRESCWVNYMRSTFMVTTLLNINTQNFLQHAAARLLPHIRRHTHMNAHKMWSKCIPSRNIWRQPNSLDKMKQDETSYTTTTITTDHWFCFR